MSKEELELEKVETMPHEGDLIIHDASDEPLTLVGEGPSDIVFTLNNGCDEVLRICEDGSFYVKGKKVTKDIEVYNGFVDFLKGTGCYKGE